MSRLLTSALAAAAALGFAAPTFAQDTTGNTSNTEMPWCSSTVTDQCRQHEGMSGTMMHRGTMMHHRMMHHGSRHHHRMMHRMTKHHEMMKKM